MIRAFVLVGLVCCAAQSTVRAETLGQKITSDSRLYTVLADGQHLLETAGFSAGGGYSPVFIRDYITFLPAQCGLVPDAQLKANLLQFFLLQSDDGNIVDSHEGPSAPGATPATLPSMVESDQGSSLVQAVSKYVQCTHDSSLLKERVRGMFVLDRIRSALQFVQRNKIDPRLGLVVGGTAIDWGDVQAESDPGGALDSSSHLAASIYPNAMYLIALDDLINFLAQNDPQRATWTQLRQSIAANVRHYLWDDTRHKFKPHAYVAGSPFPGSFDEASMLFEGGTAVAIEAGLLSDDEIRQANQQMLDAQRRSGALTISGSVYPPYPDGYFKNPIVCEFCYQNGELWPWFAGRMVRQLGLHGMLQEAYNELSPMLDMFLRDNDFFEYYTLEGDPKGSSQFKGSAGEIVLAIQALEQAARDPRFAQTAASNYVPPKGSPLWSYSNLPPWFNWVTKADPQTGDAVYYGTAPPNVQAPLSPGYSVYVVPDSAFYYFRHAPPIRPEDLTHKFHPRPITVAPPMPKA